MKQKTLSRVIYFLVISLLVLSLSGCERHKFNSSSSDDNNSNNNTQTITSGAFIGIRTPSLLVGESYKIYRGNFRVMGTNAKYYSAPVERADGDVTAAVNLEFTNQLSGSESFVITASDDNNVVFAYNPSGTESYDVNTPYGSVYMFGGSQAQMKYTSLNLSTGSTSQIKTSELEADTSNVIDIILNGSTATVNGTSVPVYNYAWHSDPDHIDEYYTLNESSSEITEDEMLANIVSASGVYINHDVRYMTDSLEFTYLDTENEEYVAYYSDSINSALGGKYIFASLPAVMGGLNNIPGEEFGGGGNPPDGAPARISVSNSDVQAFEYMTHSSEEAYNNPVLHITQPGTYRLSGTWNGQIWFDPGSSEEVTVILNGVNVTCTVAPAIVFHDVYECGPEDETDLVSFDVPSNVLADAGARVIIADNSTNTFTGSNVYRMLTTTLKSGVTEATGTTIDQQKKRYKMDGAFYSFVSMVIGEENSNGGGVLNVYSTTFEGLDAEMHLLIESGTVNVTASDDTINVNEDYVSTFAMNGGTVTLNSTGGDGIDSNGYVIINGGSLNITAGSESQNANGEAGIDAESGVYISPNANYTWNRAGTQNQNQNQNQEQTEGGTGTNLVNQEFEAANGETITINYDTVIPASGNDSGVDRTIPSTSDIFKLELEVNNFGGIQAK
ncbi:MAG: carbohydrate-binding domain-containing protein [Synergistaceae bacterium]|nr:carbohydrate-binding domain-containing protein [Synergistaceae bacterium]